MMESAIALANEVAEKSTRGNMTAESPPQSPTTKTEKIRSDSESSGESMNIMSKLKLSIKHSPKAERKRTFSDDLDNKHDIDEDLPPEAQEAYNALVVRGTRGEKESDSPKRQTPERSSVSPRVSSTFAETSVAARIASISNERSSVSPRSSASEKYSVSNNVVSSSETVRSASEGQVSSPKPVPPKPVPRRIETKKSEIPVPRPRPEVHRVEPIRQVSQPREVSPAEGTKIESVSITSSLAKERKDGLPEKPKSREDLKKTIEIVRESSPKVEEKTNEDSVNSSSSSRAESETKETDSITASLFTDDFSEPSPREIMSKLARESRIRRSLDHQRGILGPGMGDLTDTQKKNLREPSGIPVKSLPSPTTEEEEVDTNPLRMLRGGAIPIRGGHGAVGTTSKSSSSSSLRYPKLSFSHVQLQPHASEPPCNGWHGEPSAENVTESEAPAIPPRTYSCSDSTSLNPLPLPPRKPVFSGTLNAKPCERRYPLSVGSKDDCGRMPLARHLSCPAPRSECASMHGSTPHLPPPPPPPLHRDFETEEEDDSVFRSNHDNVFRSNHDNVSRSNHDNVSRSNHGNGSRSEQPTPPPPSLNRSSLAVADGVGGEELKVVLPPPGRMSINKVKCSLEQLGFFDDRDPFWVARLLLPPQPQPGGVCDDVGPMLLAHYKDSGSVSYEDLLDIAYDR